MQKDGAKVATRITADIATFDHDPENGSYGHLSTCQPTSIRKGVPIWLEGDNEVTDPEIIARYEQKYREQVR